MNRKFLAFLVLCMVILLTSVLVLAQEPKGEEAEWQQRSDPLRLGEQAVAADNELQAYPFSGGPNYDSGWVPLEQNEAVTLTHNLGGNVNNYMVDMQYKAPASEGGINQVFYGGGDLGDNVLAHRQPDDRVGAYWRNLTPESIRVYRRPEDTFAQRVRIRIWVDTLPSYASPWFDIEAGASPTVWEHLLGGDTDDYVVHLQYRNEASGINQRYYGGTEFGSKAFDGDKEDERVGAYWYDLTSTHIRVYRRGEDPYGEQARVRIWVKPTPTYDSGWAPINQGQFRSFVHGIGGNPEDYNVDMQFRRHGTVVNAIFYGGADAGAIPYGGLDENDRVGAYWRNLTDQNIAVRRRDEDIFAEEVRIRIWCFWKPRMPDYSSGWVALVPGADATELEHNLGGDSDDYYVDMQYLREPPRGINQRYYGGADFGDSVPTGHSPDERMGVYWRSLTNSSITVYRRPEDVSAPKVRIRIWIMPKPDYDSGWFAQGAGAAASELAHNLGGNRFDYLVDLQFRHGGNGVNQRYFGGMDLGANPPSEANENDRVGAYWRSLGTSSVTVFRRPEDRFAPQVRLRIWRVAEPDFDSGFDALAPGTGETWAHDVGGHEGNYLVNMVYHDSDRWGVHTRYLGGADIGSSPGLGEDEDDRQGAYWHALSKSSIGLYRRQEDAAADAIRIRIWKTHYNVSLPIIIRYPVEE